MFDSTTISYTYSSIFLQIGKIKVIAIKAGFENSEDILSEFRIIDDKWDKKG